MEENKKKSTYYAEAQKKYNSKNQIISCKVEKVKAEAIKTHAEKKGYKSINSYLIDLIDADMKNNI